MAENQIIEWKESWRDEYLKWICGFANAQGGILYIGINDNGKIVGVIDSKKLLEDIPNKVRDILGILVDVDLLSNDDKDYIRITVTPHSYPVNYKGEYHYRSGSTKQILKGAALTEFLTAKTGRNWDDIPIERVTIEALDEESFDIFRKQALKSERMDENDLKISNIQLLDSLGLLDDQKLIRAAVLLFHRTPEKWIKGSYIKIGYFETDAELRYQDEIHGSLLQQAEKVIDLLYTKYLKAEISYDNVTRIEKYPFPKSGVREAVYNAIIHKNYASQIPIQISVYKDQLYIANDCIFPPGWTVQTLMEKHRSKPYNPNVANCFFRAGLVETWGRGIEKICEVCKQHGIENPQYTLYEEDIMVKFKLKTKTNYHLKKYRASLKFDERSLSELMSEQELKMMSPILEYLKEHKNINNAKGRELTGKSSATVRRYLKKLCEVGILEASGATSGKIYKKISDV